jgi:peptidoglycan/LPS O-acetylase OafA/YrhL
MPGGLPRHPHLAWLIKLGRLSWSGVDLFFVLSGFLIGGILLDAVDSPHYFKTFYIRRAYRILPLYSVLLALAVIVERGASWLPRYVLLLQNFWMAWTGVFGVYALSVTWSLAIEEQFYLTLPPLIRFTSRKALTKIMIGAVLLAPPCRALAIAFLPGKLLAAYVLMPCRMDALGLGVLIVIATRSPRIWGSCQRGASGSTRHSQF